MNASATFLKHWTEKYWTLRKEMNMQSGSCWFCSLVDLTLFVLSKFKGLNKNDRNTILLVTAINLKLIKITGLKILEIIIHSQL